MKELELIVRPPASDQDAVSLDEDRRPPIPAAPSADEETLVLSARERIVLRCGKSSLTLHANGKIVLRGEYILSEAEDVNRLAGGRIELN